MELLGIIKKLQIQRDRLKVGEKPNRRYDPAPILGVDSLRLTPFGVVGLTDDGGEFIDVHHTNHSATRNNGNRNGVSFNFTPHYDQMRGTYGERVYYGSAGENILIESNRTLSLNEIGMRVAIESGLTGDLIYLDNLMVAAPCTEFSCYAAGQILLGEELKRTLQSLDAGMRGFYATLSNHLSPAQDLTIHLGEKVYAVLD